MWEVMVVKVPSREMTGGMVISMAPVSVILEMTPGGAAISVVTATPFVFANVTLLRTEPSV